VASVTIGFTRSDEFALASVNNSNFPRSTARRFHSTAGRQRVITGAVVRPLIAQIGEPRNREGVPRV
jgi:hypothetical protein